MLVDMHLHEKTFSTDSFLSLDEIVSIAKAKGLDAVCITDHDSMGLRETAEEYTPPHRLPDIYRHRVLLASGRHHRMGTRKLS